MTETIQFQPIKIYSFYNEPILYSAIDQFNQKYLVNLVDFDEAKGLDIWLAIPATSDELTAVDSNKISFRTFTTKHESPNVLIVETTPKESKQYYIETSAILKEWLPDSNIFADFITKN